MTFNFTTTGDTYAAEYSLIKGVESGIDFTQRDNAADSADDLTETVAIITPFVSLDIIGRRTSARLTGRLAARASSESEQSEVLPGLTATSSTNFERQRLRFDTSASIVQRVVDSPFLQDEDLSLTSTRERVVSFSAGPSFRDQFSRTQVEASYRAGVISSSETDDSRSVVQTASVDLEQNSAIPELALGTRFSTQHSAFEAANSTTTSSVFFFADYELRRNLYGRLLLGRDFIDIDVVDEVFVVEDSNVGGVALVWRPGSRLNIEASYLERYFGRQPTVIVGLEGRRSSVALSWTRNVGVSGGTNVPAPGRDGGVVAGDSTTDPSVDALGIGDTDSLPLSLFQESRNINEEVRLAYTLNGRVSEFTASVSAVNQEDLISADVAKSNLLELSLSRNLSFTSIVSLRMTSGQTRRDTDIPGIRSELTTHRIGVRWNLVF